VADQAQYVPRGEKRDAFEQKGMKLVEQLGDHQGGETEGGLVSRVFSDAIKDLAEIAATGSGEEVTFKVTVGLKSPAGE
jgi:hypothetical protein